MDQKLGYLMGVILKISHFLCHDVLLAYIWHKGGRHLVLVGDNFYFTFLVRKSPTVSLLSEGLFTRFIFISLFWFTNLLQLVCCCKAFLRWLFAGTARTPSATWSSPKWCSKSSMLTKRTSPPWGWGPRRPGVSCCSSTGASTVCLHFCTNSPSRYEA